MNCLHDDVIKWKHVPRYWPFVRGIHRSPVNYPHEGLWRRALMFSLICAWIEGWVNNRECGDLRRYRANYDVTVMYEICTMHRKITHYNLQVLSIIFQWEVRIIITHVLQDYWTGTGTIMSGTSTRELVKSYLITISTGGIVSDVSGE